MIQRKVTSIREEILGQGKEEKHKPPGLRKKVKEKTKTIAERKNPIKHQNTSENIA